ELAAILAHPPVFVLEAAIARGNLELHLALPGANVLFWIEAREVAADDFLGPVAFDALRALVPGGDMARRIEDEDRVVLYALDEPSEAFFCGESSQLGIAALGQVARDLSKSNQL